MSNEPRDTYKFRIRYYGVIVHYGITDNLDNREMELQKRWPGCSIHPIGRKTTRKIAKQWEREMMCASSF